MEPDRASDGFDRGGPVDPCVEIALAHGCAAGSREQQALRVALVLGPDEPAVFDRRIALDLARLDATEPDAGILERLSQGGDQVGVILDAERADGVRLGRTG